MLWIETPGPGWRCSRGAGRADPPHSLDAHPEPVAAIDRALADARVTLGDVGRELAEIQAVAAVDASYWDASTREGNAGADAWQAVCDFVRTTYGLRLTPH